MSVFVRQVGVEGSGGEVVVTREGDDLVSVRWFCGEGRALGFEDARTLITAINNLRAHPDVWLTFRDKNDESFAVRIDGNDLIADLSPESAEGGAGSVPWRDLRKGVRRIVGKESPVAAPEPEVDPVVPAVTDGEDGDGEF